MRFVRAAVFLLVAPLATAVGSTLCALGLLVTPGSGRISTFIERIWGRIYVGSAGGRLRVEGAEKIDRARPTMVVANHTSFLDPPTLIAMLPAPLRFVLKRELGRIPIAGWYLALSGHFLIDREDPRASLEVFAKATDRARRHGFVPVVFAEGTRSPDGRLQELRPGAFQLALTGGFDVLPVAILGTHDILPKHAIAPRRGGVVRVRVGDRIPIEGLHGSAARKVLAERCREALVALGVPA